MRADIEVLSSFGLTSTTHRGIERELAWARALERLCKHIEQFTRQFDLGFRSDFVDARLNCDENFDCFSQQADPTNFFIVTRIL